MNHLREQWRRAAKTAAPFQWGFNAPPPEMWEMQTDLRNTRVSILVQDPQPRTGNGIYELAKTTRPEWKGSWRRVISDLERSAANATLSVNLMGTPRYHLHIGGVLVGSSDSPTGPWEPPDEGVRQSSYSDYPISRSVWAALNHGSDEDLFDTIAREVFEMAVSELDYHPSLDREADIVTIYRGMQVPEGVDPVTDSRPTGGGVGYSWTINLDVAKGIAELGKAGFNAGDVSPRGIIHGGGRVKVDYDGGEPTIEWPRPVVLRAEVDVNDPEVALYGHHPVTYSTEEEVTLAQGAEVVIDGVMWAEVSEAARGELERALAEAQGKGYSTNFSVRVTWPTRFESRSVRRQAVR